MGICVALLDFNKKYYSKTFFKNQKTTKPLFFDFIETLYLEGFVPYSVHISIYT